MILRGVTFVLIIAGSAASAEPARQGSDVALRCGADLMPAGVRVDGQRFDRAPNETLEAFVGRALHGIKQPVRLFTNEDTPYRCIGSMIYMMQAAQIREIVAAPEPTATH